MSRPERTAHALGLLATANVIRLKPYREGFAVARPEGLGISDQFLFLPRANGWENLETQEQGFGLFGMLRRLKVPASQIYAALALQPVPEAPALELYEDASDPQGMESASTIPLSPKPTT